MNLNGVEKTLDSGLVSATAEENVKIVEKFVLEDIRVKMLAEMIKLSYTFMIILICQRSA